ncbi:hypothetical protein T05_468 [Trichinella murrelli]|uniref:Uncharacterized protein n=1 Tax=Trichinella murrelli TaxID=144512 RepID=A0A0V0U7I8_9BILA|nr:hypothetical protein T05_468 [Trichinella murrelli]
MATYYTGFHCEDAWMRRNGKTVQQRQHVDQMNQLDTDTRLHTNTECKYTLIATHYNLTRKAHPSSLSFMMINFFKILILHIYFNSSDKKVARSLNLYALEMIDQQQQQNDLLQLWCNKVGYTGNSLEMK